MRTGRYNKFSRQPIRCINTSDFADKVQSMSRDISDVTKTFRLDVKHIEQLIEKADHNAINAMIKQYGNTKREILQTEIAGWIKAITVIGGFLTGLVIYMDVSEKIDRVNRRW